MSPNLFAADSRLALYGLGHRVPTHDARGALELGLLRAHRTDHLQEDEEHDVPRVRLRGLHPREICNLSRPITQSATQLPSKVLAMQSHTGLERTVVAQGASMAIHRHSVWLSIV